MRPPNAGTATLLIVLLSGTLAFPAVAQESTRRDSAGLAIVTNGAIDSAPRLATLPERPAVTIGTLDGAEAEQLFRVIGAVRTREGRIIVANAGTHELRIFDAAGKHVKSIGREGRGPSEFVSISWLGLRGDTVYAYDGRLLRMSVFTTDGRLARSFTLQGGEAARFPEARAVLADGSILTTANRAYSSETAVTGAARDTALVLRFSPTGTLGALLDRLPGTEAFVLSREGAVTVSDLIFGRSAVVAGHGRLIYAGTTDGYRIDVMDVSGQRTLSIRSAQRPTAVANADVQAEREKRTIKPGDGSNPMVEQLRRNQQEMFAAMPAPRTLPAFRNIIAGGDGRLWVESYPRPSDMQRLWAVFDREGRLTGTVTVPGRITVFSIDADWLLGKFTDEDDVERVGLWRLRA
jgi:hypothetical protein